MNDTVILPAATLGDFATRVLRAAGVPPGKAELVTESLLAGSLRGVDSHGLQLLPYYVKQIEAGNIRPEADGRVVSESGSCLVFDGERGLGQVIAETCCRHVVRLAAQGGLALVVAREANHFGAAAFWGLRISSAGLIGIVMCNSSPSVAPWQGKEGRLGTNPICMSVPGEDGRPWLLDMATTTVARGKIFKAHLNRQKTIPAGWALDAEGVPTTDTEAAYRGLLMPLGGYKGSGLAMMVEILCGVLSGGAFSTEVGGLLIRERPMRTSFMFLGIDVSRFMPLEMFRERMERLVSVVKSSRPAAGYSEVLVAGDPEWRHEEIRRREGIPVTVGVWKEMLEAAARLKVPVPSVG